MCDDCTDSAIMDLWRAEEALRGIQAQLSAEGTTWERMDRIEAILEEYKVPDE